MLRTLGIRSNKGKVHVGFDGEGELALGFFRRLLQTLPRQRVLFEKNPCLRLEFRYYPVHHALVEVLAAEKAVSAGGKHLENAVVDLQYGYVEGPSAQIEDNHALMLALAHTVCQGCRRRLVDDTAHLQAGDTSRVFGGLALGIIEIGGYRNDRFPYRFAQELLRHALEILQDHRRDLRRTKLPVVHRNPHISVSGSGERVGEIGLQLLNFFGVVPSPHQSLHRIDGLAGVGDCLALGNLSQQPFSLLGESHN